MFQLCSNCCVEVFGFEGFMNIVVCFFLNFFLDIFFFDFGGEQNYGYEVKIRLVLDIVQYIQFIMAWQYNIIKDQINIVVVY